MDKVDFKGLFGNIAKQHGFERSFGGWFRDYSESIVVLDLQRSNYSNLYYLNIKIFIKGAFSDEYEERELKMHKRLVKTDGGHLFRREPKEFSPALNLENDLIENDRSDILSKLFTDFLVPFSDRASTRES